MVKQVKCQHRRDGPQTILGRHRPRISNRPAPRIWSRPEPEIWSRQKFRDRAESLRTKIKDAEELEHIFREHTPKTQYKEQQQRVDGLRKEWDKLACANPAIVRRWMKERAEMQARANVRRWMENRAKKQTWNYAQALTEVKEQAQVEEQAVDEICRGLLEMNVRK